MKNIFYLLVIGLLIFSCSSSKKATTNNQTKNKTEAAVKIEKDSVEYELLVFDVGFDTYLSKIQWPMNYYSQNYYEIKNRLYVTEWNIRVLDPFNYDPLIYEEEINYDFKVDYGLELNFKLYYYFKYIEDTYNQKFPL